MVEALTPAGTKPGTAVAGFRLGTFGTLYTYMPFAATPAEADRLTRLAMIDPALAELVGIASADRSALDRRFGDPERMHIGLHHRGQPGNGWDLVRCSIASPRATWPDIDAWDAMTSQLMRTGVTNLLGAVLVFGWKLTEEKLGAILKGTRQGSHYGSCVRGGRFFPLAIGRTGVELNILRPTAERIQAGVAAYDHALAVLGPILPRLRPIAMELLVSLNLSTRDRFSEKLVEIRKKLWDDAAAELEPYRGTLRFLRPQDPGWRNTIVVM